MMNPHLIDMLSAMIMTSSSETVTNEIISPDYNKGLCQEFEQEAEERKEIIDIVEQRTRSFQSNSQNALLFS
jgi:hypothetical protein